MTLKFKSTDSVDKRKAQSMWTLKRVVYDWTISVAEKMSYLFKVMFSDSQTARKF